MYHLKPYINSLLLLPFLNFLECQSEYQALSEQCKNYAVELLDLCQSTEEIMAILNEDSDESESFTGPFDMDSIENLSLARVKLALKYEQKRVSSETQAFA